MQSTGLRPGEHPARLPWTIPTIALVVFLVYASWLPFEFDWARLVRADVGHALAMGARIVTAEDVVTNFVGYIPLGLMLFFVAGCALSSRFARVLSAGLVGALLSLVIETVQIAIPARIASWLDVVLNGGGALTGACVAAMSLVLLKPLVARLRKAWRTRPLVTLAAGVGLGIFVYELAPFTFVTDTAALHSSLLRARWLTLLPGVQEGVSQSLASICHQMTGAAWFTVYGYVLALAARRRGFEHPFALAGAVKHAFILAFLIEIVHLFMPMHGSDLMVIMLRTLGAGLGAWTALWLVDGTQHFDWRNLLERVCPTIVLAGAVLFQLVVLAVAQLPRLTADRVFNHPFPGLVIPFEAVWRSSMASTSAAIFSTFMAYVVLAATLGALLIRLELRRSWAVTGACVMILAGSISLIHAWTTASAWDLSDPVLALVSVILVFEIRRAAPNLTAWLASAPTASTDYATRRSFNR